MKTLQRPFPGLHLNAHKQTKTVVDVSSCIGNISPRMISHTLAVTIPIIGGATMNLAEA